MAALMQTITVVNKSGKAVSTSKHLVNVFKEAKAAYQERKAEVIASRNPDEPHHNKKKPHRALKATVEDDRSFDSSGRRHSRSHHGSRRVSPERRRSYDSTRSGSRSPSTIYPSSHNRFSQDLVTLPPRSPGIQRSHTHDDALALGHRKPVPNRRSLTSPPSPEVDMALAYGDLPGDVTATRTGDSEEIKPLIRKVKRLLEEADCLHYSATAIMASLQKNPDAMAAVALTLAEISNLASKMAPGALMALKGSAPAVFALLLSPEFLIAGGVAVGITVIAFGGYKIIKRIKAKNALEKEAAGMDEMLELGSDADRIHNWRRGISEVDDGASVLSAGTSVEGEFISPQAHALSMSRLNIHDEELSSRKGKGSAKAGSSKSGSTKDSKKRHEKKKSEMEKMAKKEKERKVKKPSPLRLMFH